MTDDDEELTTLARRVARLLEAFAVHAARDEKPTQDEFKAAAEMLRAVYERCGLPDDSAVGLELEYLRSW